MDEHEDSGRLLKDLSNEELKEEAIHTTVGADKSNVPKSIVLPTWVLVAIFMAMGLIILLGIYNHYLRWEQASKLEEQNLALHLQVKDLEGSLRMMEVEKEREGQLVRIAASQEAEGSALTKLARKSSNSRDKVDQIKAQTRRYILLNANFQADTRPPRQIVEELCQLYLESTGEGCY